LDACVPRDGGVPKYEEVSDPQGRPGHGQTDNFPNLLRISDVERWRVWYHDRGNALTMTGLRALQLCAEHRLGNPLAARVLRLMFRTTGSLFKWPAESDFGGYVLRWDPATDDLWELDVDRKGHATPVLPCHWPLNSRLKGQDSFDARRYVYCIPLADARYDSGNPMRYRRCEPSKDEYMALLTAYLTAFNTFSSENSAQAVEIVALVKEQTRRVARYLQRHGYLIARPAGGVSLQGAGEIFPMFEIPFNRVFKRILGDEFRTSPVGQLSAYQHAFNAALGIDPERPWVHTLEYDDAATTHEAFSGLVFGNHTRPDREALFAAWMGLGPSTRIADGFKPYLALLLLGTENDSAQGLYLDRYLTWYETLFSRSANPATPDLVDGAYDWTLAMVVGLIVANHLNRTGLRTEIAHRMERDLDGMRDQLVHVSEMSGATSPQQIAVSQSSSAGFSADDEAAYCSSERLHLASECQDKQGNWTGYLTPLALAWQYVLDGGPNEFARLTVPPRSSVSAWNEPVVPAEVIRAAHTDGMPVPLGAIGPTPPRADSPDLPLFDDSSPPKPDDNTLGMPPRPQGSVVDWTFHGAWLEATRNKVFPYPALDVPAEESSSWKPVPAFEESESVLVRRHEFWFEGGALHVRVQLRGTQVHANGSTTEARLAGTYSLAWVRSS
jgi:hypothetical protein